MHDPHGRTAGERALEPFREDTVEFDRRHARGTTDQGTCESARAGADLQDVIG